MSTIDTIISYNEGLVWPDNYEDTYLATKHIQNHNLEIPANLINDLKSEISSAGLYFSDANILDEIATGIIRGNIILQGPPGTGKTTLASIICKVFNAKSSIITAVSDWTTYDTIGGLQPSVDDEGNEIITGKNGRIVESIINCCETVLNNVHHGGTEQASWLIIDELNRSDIDKVFGDLFTVFGSDDIEKKRIPLWFESDDNKRSLYVPNRYRILGVMNNYDKNYVFDLSHGLARRFTIINIYPPEESFISKEISNCKDIVKNKLPIKIPQIGGITIDSSYIDAIFNDSDFIKNENDIIELIKSIRYDGEHRLNLQLGTAPIVDIYEDLIIQLTLANYLNLPSNDKEIVIKSSFDSAINNKIMPQLDGLDFTKLDDFYKNIMDSKQYDWLKKCKRTLITLL